MREVTIAEVADQVEYGVTASAESSPVGPRMLRITDIQEGAVDWPSVPWCPADTRGVASSRLVPGDIVFARTGATTGKSFLIRECPEDSVFASYLIRLRLTDEADPAFVSHFFQSPGYWRQITTISEGVAQPGVNASKLKNLRIPLPSLEEQRRIAAVLDAADTLRTKRRQALAKLDTLTQAIFIDMFGDPVVNERGWERILAGEATTKIGSGATPRGGKAAYKESGISLIRSMNVHDGRFVWEGLAFIDDRQAAALSGVTVEPEDVLLNITGASVARVCLAPSAVLPARVNQHVAIVRPDTEVLHPKFLAALLLSPSMKALLLRVGGTGATREAITKGDIEVLDLVRPSLDLQLRFVEAVEGLVEIHHHGSDQSGQLDQLFGALQQRAFQGEL